MTGVLDVVKPIQHYIKFPQIWIDNIIFRLHAKVCTRTSTGYNIDIYSFRKINLLKKDFQLINQHQSQNVFFKFSC